MAYGNEFGIEFRDVSEDEDLESPIVFSGKRLEKSQAENLLESMENLLGDLTAKSENIDEDEPWKSPDALALDKQSLDDWLSRTESNDLVRKLTAIQLSSDNAIDNAQASLLAMLTTVKGGGGEIYWTDTEAYRCKGGNLQLASKLAEAIGKNNISLNDPVVSIEDKGQVITVNCKSGRKYQCNHLVMATPPSTWMNIKNTPRGLSELVVQMGSANKFAIRANSRFWRDNGLSQYGYSDGIISQTWDLTDAQDDPTSFGMVSFAGGPSSVAAMQMSKADRLAKYKQELNLIYPGSSEKISDTRDMDWPLNPNTLGGYSFPGLGEVTSVSPKVYNAIDDRIHIAGEHACLKFVGYMEGALHSGIRIAKRIAEA
jgi:monoamine oxidase